jgi:hypothetical protein
VWDPRVLEDIEAGTQPDRRDRVFRRLYDANYRDAAGTTRPAR